MVRSDWNMAGIFPISGQNYGHNLKQLCLDCIADNFKRFMLAYDESSIPAKYFEFLQRTLSKELLQKLAEKEKFVEDKYLSFLINPYLKELNLNGCFSNPEPILERLQQVGENIKLLSLSLKPWQDEMLLKFVNAVPHVETLLLHSTACDDIILRTIGERCQSVKKLDVSDCAQVTNVGIKEFLRKNEGGGYKENTVLQYLDVTSTNVSDSAITLLLKYAPMLRTLNYDHVTEVIYDMHATDFINGHIDILPKYQLTSLCFFSMNSNSRYTSQTLANVVQVCSAFCPHVTSIKIDGELDESVLSACAKFSDLKEVMLSNVSEEIAAPGCLYPFVEARGSKLHKFDLKNFVIPLQAFSNHCKRLHTLSLFASEFSDNENLTGKDCFPHMRELSIEEPNFAQESVIKSVVHLVSNCPKLEILSLRHGSSFTVDVVCKLTKSKCISNIRCIDVSYSDIDVAGILELMTAACRLERFHMELVNVTEEELKELMERSVIQKFILSWRNDTMYSSDDDEELYDPYDFEDYYNDYMGYSDEYENYDSDYSDDFYPYPV